MVQNLVFDLVSPSEIEDAFAIEKNVYPGDEAASLDSLRYRQSNAGQLFLGVFVPHADGSRTIIGYICATLANGETLTHESMSEHVPGAATVCIHSVSVSAAHQRQGVGLRLLREYTSRLTEARRTGAVPYERISLIVHEELIPFYEKGGYELLGKSDVEHGARPWFAMNFTLS
ncbi:acyl-CoA N-acyltransferase [Marasmius fiardii PR-910]|nr:acyl-CoA N-acyltransferase [Marasmius fiardii PR-910]